MNKKKLCISLILIICICLSILLSWFLFYRPFNVEEAYIRIEPVRSAEEFDMMKDYINRNSTDGSYQIFCNTDEFPSKSYEDYCYVLIHFAVKNHSLINVSVNDGYVTNAESTDFIMFKRPIAFETTLSSLEFKMSEDCYDFLCYRGDLSDEEIIDKFKELQINMLYETSFLNSLNYKYDLSKSIYVSSYEEFDEIRNEIKAKQ